MRTCAVIPAYKVKNHLVDVVVGVLAHVDHVFVVDDACPEGSGRYLLQSLPDSPQVTVIFHEGNLGVGGAVLTGYSKAREAGFELAVKVDGDGQMNPKYIPALLAPIASGAADYTKGNRFFRPSYLLDMPRARLAGNAALSFLAKVSTGQWHIMDPTNGFTAIHLGLLDWLPHDRIQKRFFFETDMLFWLGTVDAVIQDIPMPSLYGSEQSNLSVKSSLVEFSKGHLGLFFRRIFYSYFLRNFNMASVFLLCSLPCILFGAIFGATAWKTSVETGVPATAGTIMLAALPVIVGLQLLLGFLNFDMATQPRHALWKRLGK